MDVRLFAAVIAIGAMIGFSLPGAEEGVERVHVAGSPIEKPRPAPQLPDKADEADDDELVEQLLADEIILDRAPDGHFYAVAEVNTEKLRFLVDTGASVVALTAKDARALGFDWNEAELRVVGRGASGPVHGKSVVIPHMTLGDLEARDVMAIIIPHGLDVSLLGQNFLRQAGEVRIEGDRMVLS